MTGIDVRLLLCDLIGIAAPSHASLAVALDAARDAIRAWDVGRLSGVATWSLGVRDAMGEDRHSAAGDALLVLSRLGGGATPEFESHLNRDGSAVR
jgi:hypothetical protein